MQLYTSHIGHMKKIQKGKNKFPKAGIALYYFLFLSSEFSP
jgi:hypothetical protein